MKMPKLIFVFIVVIFVIGIGGVFAYKKFFPPAKIHYHAGFVVFENNKKLDFSGSNYMYIKPCVANGKEEEGPENEQMEKAHLHDGVGDVIHIEARGATWQDLFANIRYPIDYTKATGYVQNKKVIDFQKLPIRAFDSLVVFVGDNDPKYLNESVTKDYIETQAKKSTTCGD